MEKILRILAEDLSFDSTIACQPANGANRQPSLARRPTANDVIAIASK
jgi:hypothetical protein